MKVNFKKQIHPEKVMAKDTSDYKVAMLEFMYFVFNLKENKIDLRNLTAEELDYLLSLVATNPKLMTFPVYMLNMNKILVQKGEDTKKITREDHQVSWQKAQDLKSEGSQKLIEMALKYPSVFYDFSDAIAKDTPVGVTISAIASFIHNYDSNKKSVFYCPESFAKMICEYGMDKIDAKFLPTKFVSYIHFPKNLFADPRTKVPLVGAYINLTQYPNEKRFIFEVACVENGVNIDHALLYRIHLPIEGMIDCDCVTTDESASETVDKDRISQTNLVTKFLFNVMVFIHNESMELKYLNDMSSKVARKKEVEMGFNPRHSSIPVWLVNKHFHEMKYNVDSTAVKGHMRWQPYGEKLSKVKLIWIDPHVRTYKTALAVLDAQIGTS